MPAPDFMPASTALPIWKIHADIQRTLRGGNLIMTLGTADSVVPYHVSIAYYERVIERLGGLDKAQSFFRFYVVPGLADGGSPDIN